MPASQPLQIVSQGPVKTGSLGGVNWQIKACPWQPQFPYLSHGLGQMDRGPAVHRVCIAGLAWFSDWGSAPSTHHSLISPEALASDLDQTLPARSLIAPFAPAPSLTRKADCKQVPALPPLPFSSLLLPHPLVESEFRTCKIGCLLGGGLGAGGQGWERNFRLLNFEPPPAPQVGIVQTCPESSLLK